MNFHLSAIMHLKVTLTHAVHRNLSQFTSKPQLHWAALADARLWYSHCGGFFSSSKRLRQKHLYLCYRISAASSVFMAAPSTNTTAAAPALDNTLGAVLIGTFISLV